MPVAHHSVVGTIRFEPDLRADSSRSETADSTLGQLLESLAFQESLAADFRSGRDSIHLVVRARACRIQEVSEGHVSVRANLAQLASELNADYQRLTIAGS